MPGSVLPANFYQAVQMGHRFLVGILAIWMLLILIHVLRKYSRSPIIKKGWIIAFTLLMMQVLTGMLSVFTQVNIFIALFHALFITLLFGLLCYFIMLLSRNK